MFLEVADLEEKRDLSMLKMEISSIKEELEDHLVSINDSTDEIDNNYSYIIEMEERMSLIEKKLDVVLDFIASVNGKSVDFPKKNIKLNEQEQEIFMAFYTSEMALCYDDMCRRTGKSESYVRYHLNNLITKGVPVKRHCRSGSGDSKSYFTLDHGFRELQTKSNILNLSRTLTLDCFDQAVLEKKIE